MGLKITDLPVANYMTPYPISVSPDISFESVVDFMASRGIGNLIVSDNSIPSGVLTEREILQCAVSTDGTANKKVKDMGSQPFLKITLDTSILQAAKIMISKRSRLLVFANEVAMNRPVGGYSSWPLLTVKEGITANAAASIMAANNIKMLGLVRDI